MLVLRMQMLSYNIMDSHALRRGNTQGPQRRLKTVSDGLHDVVISQNDSPLNRVQPRSAGTRWEWSNQEGREL
jgi:hypothetical protein